MKFQLLFVLVLGLFCSGQSNADSEHNNDFNEIIAAVSKLCSLPGNEGSRIQFDGSVSAGGIIKLVGVKGEGKLTYEEWEGVKDVLAKDRANDRNSSRECVKEILPTILKAYGVDSKSRNESRSLLRKELAIHDKQLSGNPALRATSFREAFKSIGVFYVDLTPIDPKDKLSVRSEAARESIISNSINYYDIETGKFGDKDPSKKQKLTGMIHGETLSFKARSCSGTLQNIERSWEFSGPVTCGPYKYTGLFKLR